MGSLSTQETTGLYYCSPTKHSWVVLRVDTRSTRCTFRVLALPLLVTVSTPAPSAIHEGCLHFLPFPRYSLATLCIPYKTLSWYEYGHVYFLLGVGTVNIAPSYHDYYCDTVAIAMIMVTPLTSASSSSSQSFLPVFFSDRWVGAASQKRPRFQPTVRPRPQEYFSEGGFTPTTTIQGRRVRRKL